MYGEATFGELPFGTVLEPVGVPIIPEVAQATRELVLLIEADLVQPVNEVEVE